MRIALIGDIALFGKMSLKNNPGIMDYFTDVANYLSHFDYVVGNLETPFSVAKTTKGAKSAFLYSEVDNIQILKLLHIDAVCLANNHMFDFGEEGYETTKSILKDNGIDFFGAEGRELKIEHNGVKIAFSGYCCYTSGPLRCVPLGSYGVNAYNLLTVEKRLRSNDSEGFLNIVAVHAGLEHVNYPSIEHIKAARKMAEVVPYIYYGHHPHVIQGIEEYKGSIIAYSLGNFCFDDIYTQASGDKPLIALSENNRNGAILELTIECGKVVQWDERVVYNSKGNKMELVEITEAIKEYNDALINCEPNVVAYTLKRNQLLNAWASERRSKRNMAWYLKRLRIRYLRILINARKNSIKYKNNVLKYIKK
jgi:poly-gamma-glutamate synthesis protein (capsule biosynthesis protein)